MTTSKKAKEVYFGVNEKWVIDKFTPKELSLFLKEGKGYFEYLIETSESTQYLEDHPEFKELLKRW